MVRKKSPLLLACSALALLAAGPARAEVRPFALFTEGMVLQRDMKVPVWGTADAGERVTVRFQGQEVSAVAAGDGKWMVRLDSLKAGGPFPLTIAGTNTITLKNVLVGEVWIVAGQSNMWWTVARSNDAAEIIAHSADPQIRLFTVPFRPSEKPRRDLEPSRPDCARHEHHRRHGLRADLEGMRAHHRGGILRDRLRLRSRPAQGPGRPRRVDPQRRRGDLGGDLDEPRGARK